MKPVAFDYIRADDQAEVLEALDQYGSDAAVLAGGMSLGPMLNMRLVRPAVVVDIGRVAGLREIETDGDEIRIGATVRQAEIMARADIIQAVPLLGLALPHVGHYQTRSRGTFGGSIAHADSSAEIPLALITLGGAVELTSRRGRRRVAAVDFFKGILATERRADELVTATLWPKQAPGTGCAFAEFAQRHGDFAIAAAACSVTVTESGRVTSLSLGLGGVEDRPVAIDTTSFRDEHVDETLVGTVAMEAYTTVEPLEDITASAKYRRELVSSLSLQVLEQAMDRAVEAARR